jgi:hypothetical protein
MSVGLQNLILIIKTDIFQHVIKRIVTGRGWSRKKFWAGSVSRLPSFGPSGFVRLTFRGKFLPKLDRIHYHGTDDEETPSYSMMVKFTWVNVGDTWCVDSRGERARKKKIVFHQQRSWTLCSAHINHNKFALRKN